MTPQQRVMMRMIAKGASTKMITTTTHCREKTVRDHIADWYGARPKPGKQASAEGFYFRRQVHGHASISASALCVVGLHRPDSITLESIEGAEMLCDSHDHYMSQTSAGGKEPLITLNRHYQLLVKHLRTGQHALKTCGDCGSPYLVRAMTPALHECPFCRTAPTDAKAIFGLESRSQRRRRINTSGSMSVHSVSAFMLG